MRVVGERRVDEVHVGREHCTQRSALLYRCGRRCNENARSENRQRKGGENTSLHVLSFPATEIPAVRAQRSTLGKSGSFHGVTCGRSSMLAGRRPRRTALCSAGSFRT